MRIGIDLGGTKIEIIAMDGDGAIAVRRRVATPAGDYRGIVETIARLVAETEAACGERGTIGIGTPGAISRANGLMKNSNSTVLNGRPLRADIEGALARPVRLANDANCFALSEAIDGSGAGARCVFGVIVGTGVGGGIVIDREILVGRDAIAGEWGHNPLPWPRPDELPGPPCYCGKSGCIETFVSGTGLRNDYVRRGGAPLEGREIVARAEHGDATAEATLERYADRLARALAAIVNVLDPDAIVLGGGMSNVARLYDGLRERIGAYAFTDAFATPVVPPAHGDASGTRGAAWLWEPTGRLRS